MKVRATFQVPSGHKLEPWFEMVLVSMGTESGRESFILWSHTDTNTSKISRFNNQGRGWEKLLFIYLEGVFLFTLG